MNRRYALIALLILAGCSGKKDPEPPAPGDKAEERSEAKTDDERFIKKVALDRAKREDRVNRQAAPRKVKFLRWGPNITRDEAKAIWKQAGVMDKPLAEFDPNQPPDAFVRLRFKCGDEIHDNVYMIFGEKHQRLGSEHGNRKEGDEGELDGWKDRAIAAWKKQYPGIK